MARRRDNERRRRARKLGNPFVPYTSAEVFARDEFVCYICHLPTDATQVHPQPDAPVVDHVIPLARGGSDTLDNVRCACSYCNSRKRDMMPGRRLIERHMREIGMTTPNGSPTGANPARPRGFQHEDAAAQASPMGGGMFTGGGEATVVGTDQDSAPTGAADAASALSKLKSGMANIPGVGNFDPDDSDD